MRIFFYRELSCWCVFFFFLQIFAGVNKWLGLLIGRVFGSLAFGWSSMLEGVENVEGLGVYGSFNSKGKYEIIARCW